MRDSIVESVQNEPQMEELENEIEETIINELEILAEDQTDELMEESLTESMNDEVVEPKKNYQQMSQ